MMFYSRAELACWFDETECCGVGSRCMSCWILRQRGFLEAAEPDASPLALQLREVPIFADNLGNEPRTGVAPGPASPPTAASKSGEAPS